MVGLLFLLTATALPSNTATSTDTTRGASLLRGCQAEVRLLTLSSLEDAPPMDLINGAYCLGFLNGFTASLPSAPATVCTRDDNMAAMVRAYVDYMERNPALLEQDKRIGLRMALEAAYPCPAPR